MLLCARDFVLSMVAQDVEQITGLDEAICRQAVYEATDPYLAPDAFTQASDQLLAGLREGDRWPPVVAAFWEAVSRLSHKQDGASTPPLPIPIPYEEGDFPVHSTEHPFCADMRCPCHEDAESVEQVRLWVAQGLLSAADADRIYRGQILN
jgi:hypothetical protein